MTVLPELERQLVRAAGQTRPGGRREVSGEKSPTRGWTAVVAGCAVAAAVVLVFAAVLTREPRHPHPRTTSRPPAVAVDPTVPATYARACATTFDCLTVPPGPVPIALRRPFKVPRLRVGERCPTSTARNFSNSYIGGVSLGNVPVRPGIGNGVDLKHGRIVLGTTEDPGWFAIKTVWFSLPSYHGPWSVRAARLRGSGRIELGSEPAPRPGPGGPQFSPTVVGAAPGDTINTGAGYRTDPRTTWISAPGCYAFEVNGLGFNELMVFQAVAPKPLTR